MATEKEEKYLKKNAVKELMYLAENVETCLLFYNNIRISHTSTQQYSR